MIDRTNYQHIMTYLDYQRNVKQCDYYTVQAYWSRLRHVLEWAGNKPLSDGQKIKPTFPSYIEALKTRYDKPFSASGFSAICKTARAFYLWALLEYPKQYKGINQNWIASIRPPRARAEQSELKKREVYTLDDVIKLVSCEPTTLTMRRAQAGAAFLFLSGMRIGAFTSLPIGCIDLQERRVYQLPEKGVMTKNKKAAITTLLPIPALLEVVNKWDQYIRPLAGAGGLWYTPFTPAGSVAKRYPLSNLPATNNRRHSFGEELKDLCKVAGVEYKSPHKFRHGHAVYAMKRAKTIEQLKAISQNLMHSTIGITDGIYGQLIEDDVHAVIMSFDKPADEKPAWSHDEDVLTQAMALLQAIKQQKEGEK